MPNSIALRLATQDDCQQLFEWRNDPTTIAMSLVAEPVPWENHLRWFESVSANPERHLLVGELDGMACGTVRFDEVDDTAEISITVSPQFRGQGVGSKLLNAAAEWAKTELGLGHVIAQIKATNPASLALFKRCGYEITREGEVLALVKYL